MSAALHTDRFSADGRDLWPIARFAIYKTGSRARVERRSLAGRLSPFVATQQPGRVAGFLVAGLALRALQRAQSLDPGFTPQNALEISFDLSMHGYDVTRAHDFRRRLLERMRALPGVQYAGLSYFVPLNLSVGSNPIYVEGQPEQRGANVPMAMASRASSGFLSALGTRLIQGRDFTEQDGESKQDVAVINETFARRFWPGQTALGKRFSYAGSAGPWIEVVGVIQDGKYFSLNEAATPFVYTNMRPWIGGSLTMVARTA